MGKIKSPELMNLTTRPWSYRPGRYKQLSMDDLIENAESDKSKKISSFMDEFYVQINSLNATAYSFRKLALRTHGPFCPELCDRLDHIEAAIKCLAAVVEELRR